MSKIKPSIATLPPELSEGFSNLLEIVAYRSQHQPDTIAYTFLQNGETESGSLTYGQLDQQARQIATQLQQWGIVGERALLLYPPGLEFITAFFGCLYAGAIAVPAYPPRSNQNLDRLQAIVADCQAQVLLTTAALLPNLESRLDQYPELSSLQRLATDRLEGNLAQDWQQPDVNSNTLAFFQYTSGSTGQPKGVMVSHGNLIANLEYIKQAFELNPESVSVTWLPSFHDMGLIDGVLQPLYTGFHGVLMPPVAFLQKPLRWLQAISHYRATHCGGPNFGYELCQRKITPEQRSELDLSSWSSAYSGAEPIRQATLQGFSKYFQDCGFKPNFFYPCYGMAEATLMISGGYTADEPVYLTVDPEALERGQVVEAAADIEQGRQLVGCGRSWLDTKIVIVHPEHLTQCPTGQVGEIWVSGSSVAQGYWNNPQKTAETFQAYLADTGEGPFLRTGDLGFLREDGELFVTGRLKDVIIIRGRNHYPQDIEQTVEQSHEALVLNQSAAFSIEVDGEEKLVIVAEVERRYRQRRQPGQTEAEFQEIERRNRERRRENINPGFETTLEKPPVFKEIGDNVRQAVNRNHGLQVHEILLLRFGSIPKTSSGKIQRYACRKGFWEKSLNVVWP